MPVYKSLFIFAPICRSAALSAVPVISGFFPVHLFIRILKQGIDGTGAVIDMAAAYRTAVLCFRDTFPDVLHKLRQFFLGSPAADDDEFISADPVARVPVFQGAFKADRQRDEPFIPCHMTVTVIERFQAVHVKGDQSRDVFRIVFDVGIICLAV